MSNEAHDGRCFFLSKTINTKQNQSTSAVFSCMLIFFVCQIKQIKMSKPYPQQKDEEAHSDLFQDTEQIVQQSYIQRSNDLESKNSLIYPLNIPKQYPQTEPRMGNLKQVGKIKRVQSAQKRPNRSESQSDVRKKIIWSEVRQESGGDIGMPSQMDKRQHFQDLIQRQEERKAHQSGEYHQAKSFEQIQRRKQLDWRDNVRRDERTFKNLSKELDKAYSKISMHEQQRKMTKQWYKQYTNNLIKLLDQEKKKFANKVQIFESQKEELKKEVEMLQSQKQELKKKAQMLEQQRQKFKKRTQILEEQILLESEGFQKKAVQLQQKLRLEHDKKYQKLHKYNMLLERRIGHLQKRQSIYKKQDQAKQECIIQIQQRLTEASEKSDQSQLINTALQKQNANLAKTKNKQKELNLNIARLTEQNHRLQLYLVIYKDLHNIQL